MSNIVFIPLAVVCAVTNPQTEPVCMQSMLAPVANLNLCKEVINDQAADWTENGFLVQKIVCVEWDKDKNNPKTKAEPDENA